MPKSWDSEIEAMLAWAKRLDAGERSRLRRCHTPGEVLCEPCFGHLMAELYNSDADYTPGLAVVAGLVAHVTDAPGRLAQALAEKMSDMRFRRLLAGEAHDDEMYRHWRRAVQLLKGKAPLRELITTVYFWNERTRADLSVNFYRSKKA